MGSLLQNDNEELGKFSVELCCLTQISLSFFWKDGEVIYFSICGGTVRVQVSLVVG